MARKKKTCRVCRIAKVRLEFPSGWMFEQEYGNRICRECKAKKAESESEAGEARRGVNEVGNSVDSASAMHDVDKSECNA